MKVVIYNLGCKVNQYEADAIADALVSAGHKVAFEFQKADAYVINTCAVTGEAERKSRQMVSKCLKFNPTAAVYVCGCASENDAMQFAAKSNVEYIGGAARKSAIPKLIDDLAKRAELGNRAEISVGSLPEIYEDDLNIGNVRTRAYVKAQDGCNNFCSYCIIPYLRGRSRSRSIESVKKEAEKLSEQVGEIVLTGINLSAYGKDIGGSLTGLIDSLCDIGVRIRLGSLEVNVINRDFLDATRRLKAFCPQFHLSLQSGDDEVLKSMNRRYTAADYAEKVALIRDFYPNAAITTDIITAFPTETDERFHKTLAFIKSIDFADAHIFIYSPRSGTKAADLPLIDAATAKSRENIIKEAVSEMRRKYLSGLIGGELEVLVEDDGSGYSREYVRVYCGGTDGDLVKIKPVELYKDGLR